MGFVDLHVHSDASDGTFTPSQVVELAKNAGLDAIALTDHDTTAGVDEALEAAHHLNIEVIPGIEVSSSFDGTEIHILGLFVDQKDPVLAAMLEKMLISRDRRNEKMLENLAADKRGTLRKQSGHHYHKSSYCTCPNRQRYLFQYRSGF